MDKLPSKQCLKTCCYSDIDVTLTLEQRSRALCHVTWFWQQECCDYPIKKHSEFQLLASLPSHPGPHGQKNGWLLPGRSKPPWGGKGEWGVHSSASMTQLLGNGRVHLGCWLDTSCFRGPGQEQFPQPVGRRSVLNQCNQDWQQSLIILEDSAGKQGVLKRVLGYSYSERNRTICTQTGCGNARESVAPPRNVAWSSPDSQLWDRLQQRQPLPLTSTLSSVSVCGAVSHLLPSPCNYYSLF